MSLAALDGLIATERRLIAALDGDDPARIERATTDYANALTQVRAAGGWHATPEVAERAREAMALANLARTRVNILADLTRQRLGLLARAAGRELGIGYRRDGRLRS